MTQNGHQGGKLAVLAGFGIGVLWIAMALFVLLKAYQGFNDGRSDFGVAWSLAGVLLLAAGCASVIGTWWHALRAPSHENAA